MLTEVVADALVVCGCQMIRGSVGHQSESRSSAQAWEFNLLYDNVVGAFLLGIVPNGPGGKVAMLRFTLGGASPGAGEAHLALPSGFSPRASRDGRFVVLAAASGQVRGRVCQEPASQWGAMSPHGSDGRRTGRDRWVQCCPVSASVDGAGGRRFLAMTFEPASRDPWGMATKGRRNVNLVRMEDVDARGPPAGFLSQRAERPPAGGGVAAFSSSDGRPRSLPPLWSPRVAAELCAFAIARGAVEDQKRDQVLQLKGGGSPPPR